jgi:hypothetical protein
MTMGSTLTKVRVVRQIRLAIRRVTAIILQTSLLLCTLSGTTNYSRTLRSARLALFMVGQVHRVDLSTLDRPPGFRIRVWGP